MLLALADWLSNYYDGFRVFKYLTFRGILGILTALAISLMIGTAMIRQLSKYKIGQSVRDDGPQSHFSKAGTPTMGGALILVAVVLSTLLWADLQNRYIWTTLLVTLGFGVIGFVDDYKKLVLRNSKGLAARHKYLAQSVVGLAAATFLYCSATVPAETTFILPFFKQFAWNMGLAYPLLTYFVIVGTSNAVNLTDGLDGLAIMPTVLVAGALAIFAGFGRAIVLRHMRCDIAGAKIGHMIGRVIGLVLAGRDAAASVFTLGLEHDLRGARRCQWRG